MTFPELDIAPRTRGRAPAPLSLEFVRDLTPADLSLLASERSIQPAEITRLRERHHALARCLALGMKDSEAAGVTGYDASRISILRRSSAFQGLIEDYKSLGSARLAEFTDRATTLAITAMENLQEALENDEVPVPLSMSLEIAKFAADRTGHAPVTKNIQLNANVELGSRLQAARKRLADLRDSAIDVEVISVGEQSATGTDG